MKKILFLLSILFCISFISCSNDDDNQENLNSLIVGKWKIESSSEGIDDDEKNWIFNIKEDGTYSNGAGDEYDDVGTWSLENRTFKYTSRIGLSFSAEILELTATHFTGKVKKPFSTGYITDTYKRVEWITAIKFFLNKKT